MQTVRRSTSHADAQSARDVLIASGIPAYIADQGLWDAGELHGTAVIRVMVDNHLVDGARRALRAWDAEVAARHA